MTSRILGTIAAASLALTSLGAPAAAADRAEIARTILGATALFMLLNEIDKNNKSTRNNQHWQPDYGRDWDRNRDRGRDWNDDGSRRYRDWNVLPISCEFTVRTADGPVRVLGERCLRDELVAVNQLPKSCQVEVRSDRGSRDAYGVRCLERSGYRIEAGRY